MTANALLSIITDKAHKEHTDCLFAIVRDNTIQEIGKRLFCLNILREEIVCYRVETGITDCSLSTKFLDFSEHDYDLVELFDIADVKVGV